MKHLQKSCDRYFHKNPCRLFLAAYSTGTLDLVNDKTAVWRWHKNVNGFKVASKSISLGRLYSLTACMWLVTDVCTHVA
jgi:hypothetical protein